uniref:DUF5131 family protein n=1 Tax=Desulfobacca acetoxidans TaxID=60893 RepID=A0A7V4G8M6_9BACT
METVKLEEIRCAEPFTNLFPIAPAVLTRVQDDMQKHGYDISQPIILWAEEGVVVDGHTRLAAAKNLGLKEIPVHRKSFADEDEALAYAIHNQRHRRNLTDAEIIRCIEVLDRRKKQGEGQERDKGQFQPKASHEAIGKSAQDTAKVVGISRAKVERARTVLQHAEEPLKEAVQAGEMSINQAYQLTQEKRKLQDTGKAVFNRTNDNIKWASWTWNPVTGCKHGCPYCYARDIAARFYGNGGFEPRFHPERLHAPVNTKPPKTGDPIGTRNVFVCSMADLFGNWVPQEWIDQVIEAVRQAPQWNFLFLTKNPARLVGIDWPHNAWVGTTVDCQARVAAAEKAFAKIKATVKFLSCEPLLEQLTFKNLKPFDWLIIGPKRVGKDHEQPKWKWVENLLSQARKADIQVYFKPQLLIRPREYPEPEIRTAWQREARSG